MQGHRDLVAWKKGMQLVKDIYRATQDFPREEIYGLTSQLRRAARDLGYLTAPTAAELLKQANEVGRVLNGLRAWCASAKADSRLLATDY